MAPADDIVDPADVFADFGEPLPAADQPATAGDWIAAVDAPPLVAGSPDEPPPPLVSVSAHQPPAAIATPPLNSLREALQPIARDLLVDRAYWELLKRNASPRTFLEFVRFAFAADLEGKPGAALNQQIIVNAPFPRGPLDELPPQMRVE